MGNTPSVEAPTKGSRATQKLSKPRTGNPATAGLLNPAGISDIIRRPSTTNTGRHLSLPYGSTFTPSPRHPGTGTGTTTVEDLVTSIRDSTPGDRSSRSLFRSDPSQVSLDQRSHSVGVVANSNRGWRRSRSRATSSYVGADEGLEQAQLDLTTYVVHIK
jgi:hypothetical protein